MKLFKTLKQPFKKIDTKMSFFLLTCIGFIIIVYYCLKKNRDNFYSIKDGNYRGTVNVTKNGLDCQKWTSQKPHKHSRTPTNYPGKGLGNHNYCRNPDNEPGGAWCYTMDPAKRWEYCDIDNIWLERRFKGKYNTGGEYCGKPFPNGVHAQSCSLCPYDENGKYKGKDLCTGSCKWDNNQNKCVMKKTLNYNGYINKTASGRTCQVWNEDFPHKKPTDDGTLYNIGNHNYCRTPGNKSAWTPWCFTTDPKQRWERCNIDDEPEINNIVDNARAQGYQSGLIQGTQSGLAEGKALGLAEGEATGLAQGRAEGETTGVAQGYEEGISKVIDELENKINKYKIRPSN